MDGPMKPPSDAQLNRLLSGKARLTRADKDAVLESLLERPAEERAPSAVSPLAGLLRWGLAAAAVAGGIALLARTGTDPFTARGGGVEAPSFTVHCAKDMASGRCPLTSKLLFRVEPRKARRLALLAQRRDAVVWYVTDQDLTRLSVDGLLEVGIPLLPDHTPGHYQVIGVFSDGTLSKDALRALVDGEPVPGTTVVRRELEVEP